MYFSDELLVRLRAAGPAGMSRTELLNRFGRKNPGRFIGATLALLRDEGEARMEKWPQPEGKGRPVEMWFAI